MFIAKDLKHLLLEKRKNYLIINLFFIDVFEQVFYWYFISKIYQDQIIFDF